MKAKAAMETARTIDQVIPNVFLDKTLSALESNDGIKKLFCDFQNRDEEFGLRSSVTVEDAESILGYDKVLTLAQAQSVFREAPVESKGIRHYTETLFKCSLLNATGFADWRLIYILPLSFMDLWRAVGNNRRKQPSFYDNDWWQSTSERKWANAKPAEGYCLINMRGAFGGYNWWEQGHLIHKLGKGYRRADTRVFTQALISLHAVKGERLHSRTFHSGTVKDSQSLIVQVGNYNSHGIRIYHCGGEHPDNNKQVCVTLAHEW